MDSDFLALRYGPTSVPDCFCLQSFCQVLGLASVKSLNLPLLVWDCVGCASSKRVKDFPADFENPSNKTILFLNLFELEILWWIENISSDFIFNERNLCSWCDFLLLMLFSIHCEVECMVFCDKGFLVFLLTFFYQFEAFLFSFTYLGTNGNLKNCCSQDISIYNTMVCTHTECCKYQSQQVCENRSLN